MYKLMFGNPKNWGDTCKRFVTPKYYIVTINIMHS